MSLEADVAYVHLIDGVRQTEVPPGFAVRAAPRRAARSRDRDMLLLGLYMNSPLQAEWLDHIASVYFGTPGSVTAATRAAISALNSKLLDTNRLLGVDAVSGGLSCAVLRGNELYVAQSGPGQVIILHANAVERFPAASRDSRPLGLGQMPDVQYFHTSVAAADYVLLTRAAPAAWESTSFTNLPSATLESAVARLTRLSGSEACVLVARFVAEGIPPARPRSAITAAPLPPAEPLVKASVEPPTAVTMPESAPQPVAAEPASEPVMEAIPVSESDTSALAGIISRVRASTAMGDSSSVEVEAASAPDSNTLPAVVQIGEHAYEFEEDENAEPVEADEESKRFDLKTTLSELGERLKRWFTGLPLANLDASLKRGFSSLGGSLSGSSSNLLGRVLPEGGLRAGDLRIPNSVLMAVAILTPILIGLLVGVVYVQRGRDKEFREYLEAAKLEASLARTAPDPLAAQPHWETTLSLLNQADIIYAGRPESAALRAEAQQALDAVDNVQRLAFEPLIQGGLAPDATLTELVVNGNEVYALDSSQGRVYRALLTEADRFSVDRGFECSAGPVGSYNITHIVDIVWLNTPNIVGKPALLAMDADGDLMYCKPDGTLPEASGLIPPDSGWKSPQAIELYADRLYVLDPGGNQIWSYDRVGGVFSDRPKNYFTTQVFDLSSAVSFTIAQGDIYILRADGRLTFCARDPNTLEPSCVENALYSDSRPGRPSGDRLQDMIAPRALFYDPPPEPSLYLLDQGLNGVYQLSLKLVLQRQQKPEAVLPEAMTAIAIGSNKDIFVAAGNNVFRAQRP
ncbi:MAG: hypothetical protein HYZ49_18305 [Chloroflexi bacterium]|nr:hypothetical protein [Chloroflexota bacterium]